MILDGTQVPGPLSLRAMLGQEALGIAHIAKETGLTRQTVYRIKDDPAGSEAALAAWATFDAAAKRVTAGSSAARSSRQGDQKRRSAWCGISRWREKTLFRRYL